MAISKLQASAQGTPGNSTGANVASSVNALITLIEETKLSRLNLKDNYQHNGTVAGSGLLSATKDGIYYGSVATGYTDLPVDDQLSGSDSFILECFDTIGNDRFIMQRLTHWSVQDRSWIRRVDTVNTTATAWLRVDATNLTASDMSDQYIYRDSIATGSLNQAFEDGTYTVIKAGVTDIPAGLSSNFVLRVTLHGNNYQLQEIFDLSDSSIQFSRINRPLIGIPEFNSWNKVNPKRKLEGKKVVFIGDSITESYNVPYYFELATGANVSNFGIGGTRLGRHTSAGYKDMSGFKIAQAMAAADWTTVVAAGVTTGDVAQTEGLRDTDWSTVDYLVVGYGTNDFGGSVEIGTIADTNEYYFYAAIDIMIKNIITTHPHLKILWWSPPWRGYTPVDPGGIAGGSDVSANAVGSMLTDYIDVMELKLKQYKQQFLNIHDTSGITEETKAYYLTDLLHPTPAGAEHLGNKIAAAVEANF